MPIYEFYCAGCNTIFNFYSSRVDTDKRPNCPHCKDRLLDRLLSPFVTLRRTKGRDNDTDEGDLPFPDLDEDRLERAMTALAQEAENLDEDDPRQAAQLMRKLSDMTGLQLGPAMQEALNRMEAGEDPEQIEEELGDQLEEEDPFSPSATSRKVSRRRRRAPKRDETLYFL